LKGKEKLGIIIKLESKNINKRIIGLEQIVRRKK